ncbi:MAG TPA: hypothetical protein VH331_04225 [Allosphingosinicella sp.]|nr:hypothetical protein [Allosphingosinicella sp.]
MLFALIGLLKPGAEDRLPDPDAVNEHLAQPFRRTHLAGYLCRDGGRRAGVMMLIEADDFAQAEGFLRQSPFLKADLYERVETLEYALEVGRLD